MSETIYDKARAANIKAPIILGKDDNGKVQLFVEEIDKESAIVLLERARNALVKSLDG